MKLNDSMLPVRTVDVVNIRIQILLRNNHRFLKQENSHYPKSLK